MTDVAWGTSSHGTWSFGNGDIYKNSPSSSWVSFNSGQSTTDTFRFYDVEPNAAGASPSWFGATTALSASTSYPPNSSAIKYGFQFPNGTSATKFRTIENGVATERDTWSSGDKFEIDATADPPKFYKNGSLVHTAANSLDGTELHMSCNIQNTGTSLYFDNCKYEAGGTPPVTTSTTFIPPPPAQVRF